MPHDPCLATWAPGHQVGFIDFGIVGRVSPTTWAAVRGLADGLATSDYAKMAKALVRAPRAAQHALASAVRHTLARGSRG